VLIRFAAPQAKFKTVVEARAGVDTSPRPNHLLLERSRRVQVACDIGPVCGETVFGDVRDSSARSATHLDRYPRSEVFPCGSRRPVARLRWGAASRVTIVSRAVFDTSCREGRTDHRNESFATAL